MSNTIKEAITEAVVGQVADVLAHLSVEQKAALESSLTC